MADTARRPLLILQGGDKPGMVSAKESLQDSSGCSIPSSCAQHHAGLVGTPQLLSLFSPPHVAPGKRVDSASKQGASSCQIDSRLDLAAMLARRHNRPELLEAEITKERRAVLRKRVLDVIVPEPGEEVQTNSNASTPDASRRKFGPGFFLIQIAEHNALQRRQHEKPGTVKSAPQQMPVRSNADKPQRQQFQKKGQGDAPAINAAASSLQPAEARKASHAHAGKATLAEGTQRPGDDKPSRGFDGTPSMLRSTPAAAVEDNSSIVSQLCSELEIPDRASELPGEVLLF